jgi:hypothetical protein
VEITLARRAVSGERRSDAFFSTKLTGQREAVGHREHGAQVRDHPDDPVRQRSEVERAIAAVGEPALLAEQLPEQPREIDPARREHAQVAVHRKDEVVGLERRGHAHRDRLLPDSGKPLRELSLPQQVQHLLFDHPGEQDRAIKRKEALVRREGLGHARDWSRHPRWPQARAHRGISATARRVTSSAHPHDSVTPPPPWP